MADIATPPGAARRRRLRAVFAADAADFGGLVQSDETGTLQDLWRTRRLAREELDANGGWLFGMPGDGIFALFESAVDAVRCALLTQSRLAAQTNVLRLRIGVHLGEVLFQDDLPFGEALIIAARLESLAEPGGILVSAAVMDAVAPRISATFERCGVKSLKHSTRRITTFSVKASDGAIDLRPGALATDPFDSTMDLDRTGGGLDRTSRGGTKTKRSRKAQDAEGSPVLDATRYGLDRTRSAGAGSKRNQAKYAGALDQTSTGLNRTGGSGSGRRSTPRQDTLPEVTWPPAAPHPRLPAPKPRQATIETCRAELTQALTTYIGPFARLVLKKQAAEATDVAVLVERLAGEITTTRDRDAFLKLAQAIITRNSG